MQKKLKKSKITFFAFTAVFAVAMFYAVMSYGPALLQAQNFDFQQRALDDAVANGDAGQSELGDIDVLELAFPDNRKGCINKAGMFLAASKSYKAGDEIDDIIPMTMLRPIFEEIYKTLRDKGTTQASLDNLEELQKCLRTAEPAGNSKSDKEDQIKISGCNKLSDTVQDILSAIKRRQKITTIMNTYENKKIDLSGTYFEEMKNPVSFLAGQLYSKSVKSGYDAASEMGTTLAISCYI